MHYYYCYYSACIIWMYNLHTTLVDGHEHAGYVEDCWNSIEMFGSLCCRDIYEEYMSVCVNHSICSSKQIQMLSFGSDRICDSPHLSLCTPGIILTPCLRIVRGPASQQTLLQTLSEVYLSFFERVFKDTRLDACFHAEKNHKNNPYTLDKVRIEY